MLVRDAIISALLVSAAAAFAAVTTTRNPESDLARSAAAGSLDLHPDPDHRLILGVNIHRNRLGFDPKGADKLQTTLGLLFNRDEIGQSMLRTPGLLQRSIRLSAASLEAGGGADASDVLTLTGGGSREFVRGLPLTDGERASFADFLGKVASNITNEAALLEIWNEWNLPTPLRAAGTVESYGQLVKASVPILRNRTPGSKILIGSIGNDITQTPQGPQYNLWTNKFLKTGLWKMGDGLSVHLYANCMTGVDRQPITLIARLLNVEHGLRQANNSKYFPLYVTEVGWPERVGKCGFSDDERRDFPAQFLLLAQGLNFVKGVWIYELIDSPGSKSDLETKFGLSTADYDVKPTSCGIREITSILKNGGVRRASSDKGVVTVSFDEAQPFHSAVWTTDGRLREMALPQGSAWRPLCSSNSWNTSPTVNLSSRPIFIKSLGS